MINIFKANINLGCFLCFLFLPFLSFLFPPLIASIVLIIIVFPSSFSFFFFELEFLAEEWEEDLNEAQRLLYTKGAENYKKCRAEYISWRAENIPDWNIMAEQLMVYFLYTYFCGSVYDEYVASKVKMSVLSVFYVEEMLIAQKKIRVELEEYFT